MTRDDIRHLWPKTHGLTNVFCVGVSTSGIYGRPMCRARLPEDSCIFFSTAAEAEQAGYRPCLISLEPWRSYAVPNLWNALEKEAA